MARAPFARWVGPTPNRMPDGMRRPIRGLVLHITQGAIDGAESWLKNPKSKASAHFLNPKVGQLRQLVDIDDRAWTQGSGNLRWVSVENEGRSGDALTPDQLHNNALIMRWLNETENVPLQLSDDPDVPGLGWHGMGGRAWGGHPDCPGPPVVAQRARILELADRTAGPTTPGEAMARLPNAVDACLAPGGGVWVVAKDGGVGAYGGAPFHGSYPGLPPEQRQGDRQFLSIHPHGGGYAIVADDGSVYVFGP